MPVSIDKIVKRSNNGFTNQNNHDKKLINSGLTGNGLGTRGYFTKVNGQVFDLLGANDRRHQNILTSQRNGMNVVEDVKNIFVNPFMNGAKRVLTEPVDNTDFLQQTFNVITDNTEDDNDIFDTKNSDKWSQRYQFKNGAIVELKLVATAVRKYEAKNRGKKLDTIFDADLMLITKITTDDTKPFKYRYDSLYDAKLIPYNIEGNLHAYDYNPVIISPIFAFKLHDTNNATNALTGYLNDIQQYADVELANENSAFNVASLLDDAAYNVTDKFVETYTRGFNFWGQAYDACQNGNYGPQIPNKDAIRGIYATFKMINESFDDFPKAIRDLRILDDYQKLYQVEKRVNEKYLHLGDNLFSQSLTLNLRLNDNLGKLKEVADNNELFKFEANNAQVTKELQLSKDYSLAQKKIITETDPLVVGVAGAGSGKSHTIVGRLQYMKDQGVDMTKVLVLSFTNTAADNITARYPEVRSLTLSKLFHSMYQLNFTNQQLSDDAVLSASLGLVNQYSKYFTNRGHKVSDVREVLDRLVEPLNDMNAYRPKYSVNSNLNRLSNVVNTHFDLVVDILNSLQQVSITLEPIIINAMLMNNKVKNIVIPKEVQNVNFIITDESQDISTFEYVLLTELTTRYKANLMIIGDATQTLYEFRDSNPDFLNTIESSNVFTNHRLNRNYRSNGDILALANQFLDVIRANRFAKMQLTSNDVTPTTYGSFKKNVSMVNMPLESMNTNKDYNESIRERLGLDGKVLIDYIVDKLQKHEQIGLLAYTKNEVKAFQKFIENTINTNYKQYGLSKPATVGSLLRDQKRPTSLVTRAVGQMDFNKVALDMNLTDFRNQLTNQIFKAFSKSKKAQPFVPSYADKAIDNFVKSNIGANLIYGALGQNPTNTPKQVFDMLKRELMNAEIKYNQLNTYLNLTANSKEDEINNILEHADIVTSTIHSAKGLEFDNTVVIYRETERGHGISAMEEKLRLYGVALTRAKKTELVINTLSDIDNNTSYSHDKAGMYQTPIRTGYSRVLDDLRKQITKQP